MLVKWELHERLNCRSGVDSLERPWPQTQTQTQTQPQPQPQTQTQTPSRPIKMPKKRQCEAESGRGRDLLQQGPGARGWASARFCVYPQVLIIKLPERAHLSRLQILAHEHLISEKIELHIADINPDREERDKEEEEEEVSIHRANFTLLGHLKLSDNTHSNFKARELKSVSLQSTAVYLKLTLHKNHVNKLNLYNQVGLIGVNVIGNEVEDNNNSVSPDGEGGRVPGGRRGAISPSTTTWLSLCTWMRRWR
ncbi:Centrosomal protein [Chionoecetes opilio]|uniref:Centrosomal protein n=1 Tax=Chionoecetes opilio TaxID=41210 RepID=A0A8J4YKA4_CHIOP|nr:Centrosomal protein [Chionoecetes opilio]